MLLSLAIVSNMAFAEDHPVADTVSTAGLVVAGGAVVWEAGWSAFLLPKALLRPKSLAAGFLWTMVSVGGIIAFDASVPLTLVSVAGADPGQPRWAGGVGWALYGAHLGLTTGWVVCPEREGCPYATEVALGVGSIATLAGAFALGVTQYAQNHQDRQIPTLMVPVFQHHW